MASRNSTGLRLLLRAGLLAGTLLDAALAITLFAVSQGWEFISVVPAETVSYSWLLWPALGARSGVQAFACYDRHRYDQAIPWLALTLVLTGIAGWLQDGVGPGLVASYGLIGTAQLLSWRRTRG